MKAVIICFLALASVALAGSGEKYTNRYDGTNVKEILNNKRLLFAYIECCLDRGKCTSDAKELKSHIQEAMETDCAKCTDAQRDGTKEVISHLINHEPAYWEEFKAKFDPTGKYAALHEKELREAKQ